MTAAPTPSGVSLAPGAYLLELRAAPGVTTTADDLRRALELAGFDSVISDEPGAVRVPPHVGAAMALVGAMPLGPRGGGLGGGPSPGLSPAAAMRQAMTAAQTSWTPSLSPRHTELAAATQSIAQRSPVIQALAAAQAAKRSQTPGPKKGAPRGLPGLLGGGGGDGGGGGGSDGSSSPDAGPPAGPDIVPDPTDDRYATDASTGQRYYMDPNTGTVYGVDQKTGGLEQVDQQTLTPVQGAAELPPPPPPGPQGSAGPQDQAFSQLLEQGADVERPYGEDPAFSMHVGGDAITDGDVYRVVARTPTRVTLRPAPGLSWAARRLSVDPYADLPIATRAFILSPGRTYDTVVLARDRRAKSRGDVWTLAEAMGFEPHAIALLRRDVHPPRRTGGYSRWLLVATWRGPHTVTTAEEPFVFDQVAAQVP